MGEIADAGDPVMYSNESEEDYMLRFVVAIRILANETYC